MRVVIGNKTFDSTEQPVALVLTEKERRAFLMGMPKVDPDRHVLVFFPGDIPPPVMMAWMQENVPEYKSNLPMQLTSVGKLAEGA